MSAFLIILMVAIICLISYEKPIKVTSQNLNYHTIKATFDVIQSAESEHKNSISNLLRDGLITQREIELAADELMINRGMFTRNPFRLDEGQFNLLVWFYFSQFKTLSRSEQNQLIYKIAE